MVTNIGLSAVATGAADVITATYSPVITLSDRRIVFLTGCVANLTTTPTFNPNALGAQVIKGKGGVALKAGEILGDCILIYHTSGTYWELLASQLTRSNLEQILANGQAVDAHYNLIGSEFTWNGNDVADQPFASSVAQTAEDNAKAYADTNFQPLDSDLTQIAGLLPSNDDIIQRKAGSWVRRTLAQLWTDLKDLTVTLTNKTLAVGSNSITGTASRVAQFGSGGSLEASSTTATQLSYLDATSSIQTQLDGKVSDTTFFQTSNQSIADSTSYFIAAVTSPATSLSLSSMIPVKAGTVVGASLSGFNASTVGSNEAWTVKLWYNGGLNSVTLTTAFTGGNANRNYFLDVDGLSTAISDGNCAVEFQAPALATNPTGFRPTAIIYIRR